MKTIVINSDRLTAELKKQFDEVLKKAGQDKFLGEDYIKSTSSHKVIIDQKENKVVGFFTPRATGRKGEKWWRAGALFLIQQARGQGIMEKVLAEFFATHHPALSWIDDANVKSIGLFKRLGFEKERAMESDGCMGHWYLLIKPPKPAVETIRFSW
jgi:L-amino acid N-acyltransferase YncA